MQPEWLTPEEKVMFWTILIEAVCVIALVLVISFIIQKYLPHIILSYYLFIRIIIKHFIQST